MSVAPPSNLAASQPARGGALNPLKTWMAQVPPMESSSDEFKRLVLNDYGVSAEQLKTNAQLRLALLTKAADRLAREIDPGSTGWRSTIQSLESQRLANPEQVMHLYRSRTPEILDYLKQKGWIPPDTKLPKVVEDKRGIGTGASVSSDTGDFNVETSNRLADVYLPPSAPLVIAHELIHSADFQEGGMSEGPITEGLAYHIEQAAFRAGGLYKTKAEELLAAKWQMVRNVRVIKTLELQLGQTTALEVRNYLVDKLGISPAQAKSEVEMMLNDPSWRISYAAGSDGITALWAKVRENDKSISYGQFLRRLHGMSGTIPEVAKRFGIRM
jgi:hypothetical protein